MGLKLVTGGAGFIGSHITERLLADGGDVRVIDDFSSGRESNLELDKGTGSLEIVRGSITDERTCRDIMKGVEHVFHQAAIPSVPRSVSNPAASNEANVTGSLNLLIAARDEGVSRFVYASSSSVYGESPTLPKVETMPTDPLSPYAISKLAAEQYARVFFRLYKLPTIGLRYFNIFGPRQDPTSQYAAVVPRFITSIAAGEKPTIFGDGEQTRDFTYVANAVDANIKASRSEGAAFGNSYNVACGRRISLLDLVNQINGILGTFIKADHTEERAGDVKHSLADIEAAGRDLDYSPDVGLEEGLERTARWFTRES